ncbi:MAG TPA: AbrB/MazE/SpoVT family DNA-binding domain-containing protein [Trueperaceae bacterium]
MRTRIVKIGNSQGIRIPKPLIEKAGVGEEVDLEVEEDTIVIRAADTARRGWSEAFAQMAAAEDDHVLDEPVATRFDDDEWEW